MVLLDATKWQQRMVIWGVVLGGMLFPTSSWSHTTTSTESAQRTIAVDARAELEVSPDVVDLRLELRAKANRPQQAVAELNQKRDRLRAALTKAGLTSKDLSVSFVQLRPEYKRYTSEIIGYSASLYLLACIRNPARLGHFVEAAASADIHSFSTSFRSTRIAEHRVQLRAMAVQAAREKAQQLAKAAGVKVGEVRAIRETQGRAAWGAESNVFGYRRARPDSGPIQPDAIRLNLSIHVIFAIQ